MKGTVYLLLSISPEGNEYHKIGITTRSVEKRISQLQTGNPHTISILRQYKTQNYLKIEKMLHRRFKCLTEQENEWRRLEDKDVFNFISTCEEMNDNINFLLEYSTIYK